ncbi:hypothetical protein PFISCL1PPCAC_14333, partial [Pristionchus fissidentatus]
QEEEWKSPTRIKLILDLLDRLNVDKWSLIPCDVEKILYVEVVSIADGYRRRGLAKELLELSYAAARQQGCTGAFAECTSHPSQMLFGTIGYRVLREIQLKEFLGIDGLPVFVCPDGTKTAQ